MPDIEETLAERGSRYSDFRDNAIVAQDIKAVFRASPKWTELPCYMQEGLDMFASKISRMLTGDYLYDDNVHDIIGYAKLMQDRMAQDRENPPIPRVAVTFRGLNPPMVPGTLDLGDFVQGAELQTGFGADWLFDGVMELGFLDSLGFALALLGEAGFRVNDDGGITNDQGETPDVVYQQHFHKSEIPIKVDGSKVPAPSFFRDPLRTVMTRDNDVTEMSLVRQPATILPADVPEPDAQLRQDMWDDHRGRVAWGYTSNPDIAAELDAVPEDAKIDWLQENVMADNVDLYNMRQEDAADVFCLGAFEIPKN